MKTNNNMIGTLDEELSKKLFNEWTYTKKRWKEKNIHSAATKRRKSKNIK